MHVELWMQREVITVSPQDSVASAKQLLVDNRIRRLPVVDGEVLVGIVGQSDLEKALPSRLDVDVDEIEYMAENTPVEAVMTASPLTVGPQTSLIEAVGIMRGHKVDGLPVVSNGRMVGIVSITDILDAFLDIMTTQGAGTCFDLKIDHRPESFYTLIQAFAQTGKEILAILQHYEFSKDNQLITILTRGDDNDELTDLLWQKKIKVEKITELG